MLDTWLLDQTLLDVPGFTVRPFVICCITAGYVGTIALTASLPWIVSLSVDYQEC